MGWLAILARVVGPLLEVLWPIILDAITTKRQVIKTREAVVVRPDRAEVAAGGADRLADVRRRYGLPVVLVGLLALGGCATREIDRVELVPTIIDAGPALPNGAKIATSEPVPVVVFGADGEPVAGGGPAPVNLSGAVIVPHWRWLELIRSEKALASIKLTPEQAAAVAVVLGRR